MAKKAVVKKAPVKTVKSTVNWDNILLNGPELTYEEALSFDENLQEEEFEAYIQNLRAKCENYLTVHKPVKATHKTSGLTRSGVTIMNETASQRGDAFRKKKTNKPAEIDGIFRMR